MIAKELASGGLFGFYRVLFIWCSSSKGEDRSRCAFPDGRRRRAAGCIEPAGVRLPV